MAREIPSDSITVEGSNGYALSLHAFGDHDCSAVITGIKTGKRHANVAITSGDERALLTWLAARHGLKLSRA